MLASLYKKFSDVVYNKYRNMCHKAIYKWCQNVQDTSALVPKCLGFYGGAEMSNGHFCTSTEMSWVRSVLGPKCPYTV